MSKRAIVHVVACGLALVWPLAAQVPPRDAAVTNTPQPTGTAAIAGRVTADEGGRPIRLANIVVIGVMTGTLRVTASDADGRFAVDALPADRYLIGASKPPLLGAMAGARRPARFGTPISVADGQKVTDVAIRMPKGAVISGVVTDERGQPAQAMVGIQRRGPNGDLAFVPPRAIGADERGRYRFFGLPPGEYFVVAMREPRPLTDSPAPTYFPGTTRANDAAPIALTVGEERGDVDIRLETVRTAVVEGTVASAEGTLPAGLSVQLSTSGSSPIQSMGTANVLPDGRFSFPRITPGSYLLIASNRSQPSQFAAMTIEVAGTDRSGIQLMLRPPPTVSGRLVFDGATSPPALAGFRVAVRNLSASSGMNPPSIAPTNAQGEWAWSNVLPGRYAIGGPLYFGPNADSLTWALESVTANGRDITDRPLEIGADAPPTAIVVTYSDRWQSVSGRVRTSSGQAVTDYTVVIFPADEAYWMPGSRRILIAHPGTDGRFTFGGAGPLTLPAGQYRLAAVTDVGRDEVFDPAFLRALMSNSMVVTVAPGAKVVEDLVIR